AALVRHHRRGDQLRGGLSGVRRHQGAARRGARPGRVDPRSARRRRGAGALTNSRAPSRGAAFPPFGRAGTMNDIAAFIATVHPYDSLPQDELARAAAAFKRRDYPAGGVIYRRGDRLAGLYLIESGRVRVSDAAGDSVSELMARNSFGERGLLRDGVAVTTATAIEDST